MIQQSLSYSDVSLYPIYCSDVKSRDDVDTSIEFLGLRISIPIIAAPMQSVVGVEFAKELYKLGSLACLPRTNDRKIDRALFIKTKMFHIPSFSREQVENGEIYFDPDYPMICLDVANGFNTHIGAAVKKIKKQKPKIKVITGNVGSVEGYRYLAECGADAVRCNIGSGAGCLTSMRTSVGSGSFSLIREIAKWRDEYLSNSNSLVSCPLIIADGGVHSSREVILAIAAGADLVMAGRIFASATESPGPVVKYQNRLYKPYAGQASKAVKRSDKYIEGDDTLVLLEGNLSQIWSKLKDGIASACSYMGCSTIEELKYLPDECFRVLSAGSKREREIHA